MTVITGIGRVAFELNDLPILHVGNHAAKVLAEAASCPNSTIGLDGNGPHQTRHIVKLILGSLLDFVFLTLRMLCRPATNALLKPSVGRFRCIFGVWLQVLRGPVVLRADFYSVKSSAEQGVRDQVPAYPRPAVDLGGSRTVATVWVPMRPDQSREPELTSFLRRVE